VPQRSRARGLFEEDAREQGHRVLAHEGRAPGEALEEHAAEGEDVGARADLALASRLLGGDVAGRAEEQARPGRGAGAPRDARDAEVEHRHLREVSARKEEVSRLDVAVDDPLRVRGGERAGDARDEGEALGHGEPRAREAGREVFAREPIHREPERAVGAHAVSHVAHDRRVRERGEHARLLREARRALSPLADDHLHGDLGAAQAIARAPHGAHAARAGERFERESSCDDLSRAHASEYRRSGALGSMDPRAIAKAVSPGGAIRLTSCLSSSR
jgi:hypothetical protein